MDPRVPPRILSLVEIAELEQGAFRRGFTWGLVAGVVNLATIAGVLFLVFS